VEINRTYVYLVAGTVYLVKRHEKNLLIGFIAVLFILAGGGVWYLQSVQKAIEFLKDHTYDAIIADHKIPEMTCVKELYAITKFHLITGLPAVSSGNSGAGNAIRVFRKEKGL
jgi:hypothetical protein